MQNIGKFYIKTFGCQMNEYDSQKINNILYKLGYTKTSLQTDADISLINTCHIRNKAKQKLYSALGKINKIKIKRELKGKKTIVIVAGCVAQAEGEEIFKRAPYVDLVVGSQSYQELPKLIKRKISYINNNRLIKNNLIKLDFTPKSKFDNLPKEKFLDEVSSYLTIQEGCDKFCKFCVVPYTRGPEYSRPVNDILSEAKNLVSNGSKEIVLLGQNVNAFHGYSLNKKKYNLGKLIYELSNIDGLERIRYMTAHPKDMHEDLYNAHRDIEQLMPFLHLPAQSGSNKILKSMNRNYTFEEYLEIVKKIKKIRPDIAFSSDFIIGYPGETKEDFKKTLDLIDIVEYAQSFSFIYSPRPGTMSYKLSDEVSDEEKKDRLIILQNKLKFYQEKFNNKFLKKSLNVLFTNSIKKRNYQSLGYSPYMQLVRLEKAKDMKGKIKNLKIIKTFYKSLEAVNEV